MSSIAKSVMAEKLNNNKGIHDSVNVVYENSSLSMDFNDRKVE